MKRNKILTLGGNIFETVSIRKEIKSISIICNQCLLSLKTQCVCTDSNYLVLIQTAEFDYNLIFQITSEPDWFNYSPEPMWGPKFCRQMGKRLFYTYIY